ncbi:MAG: Nif3-like dinuclear metal center hexameric protein [Defluviitaleaceae bacterium]|nr:Nif3-like dinuclear metal center hexameric protein [Defluviitaleaceae bacterium]
MKATDLYRQLEQDFVKPGMKEDWYVDMTDLAPFICDNYKQRSMGLLCDFAGDITKVYTAVFPSDRVLTKILQDDTEDALIFLHHPMDWDLSKDPNQAFYNMNLNLLAQLKSRRIALFNFHYPLDNYGEYSTSKTLAEALGLTIEAPFHLCSGALCGVITTTKCKTVHELNVAYSQAVGHETKLYPYGDSQIANQRVAVVAGGGNDADVVRDAIAAGVNTLISGLSVNNVYSQAAHELEQAHGINLLGGTHYSSEKFACMAMCEYFRKLGLPAEFVPDAPCLQDL